MISNDDNTDFAKFEWEHDFHMVESQFVNKNKTKNEDNQIIFENYCNDNPSQHFFEIIRQELQSLNKNTKQIENLSLANKEHQDSLSQIQQTLSVQNTQFTSICYLLNTVLEKQQENQKILVKTLENQEKLLSSITERMNQLSLDENYARAKNLLVRKHVPFGFVPDFTFASNNYKVEENKDNKHELD